MLRTTPLIRIVFLFAGFLACGAGCHHVSAPPSAEMRAVAFGDSITHGYGVPQGLGWVELLSARYRENGSHRVTLINAGGDGNTSTEGLRRLETDVLSHRPGLVLVEFGGNDATEGVRNVTLDDYERNLRAIHRAVIASGGKMVLLTFPPVINSWHVDGGKPYFLERGGLDQEVERYRQRTRQLAQQLGLPLFDLDRFLRDLMELHGPARYIASDGVHLTPAGNRLVAESIEKFLAAKKLIAARE